MFEKIVVRQAVQASGRFSPGLLAEVVLFYGQIHIILNWGMLNALFRDLGVSTVVRLLQSGYVRATYIQAEPGLIVEKGTFDLYTPALFGVNLAGGSHAMSVEEEVEFLCSEYSADNTRLARSAAREVLRLTARGQLNDGTPRGLPLTTEFIKELRANPNLTAQAKFVLNKWLPGQESARASNFEVRELQQDKFVVVSDVNWSAAHADYVRLHNLPSGAEFEAGTVLKEIQSGYIDLGLAARFGTELLTTDLQELLVTHRIRQMMQAKLRSDQEIAVFNQKIFGGAFALRTVIDSKMRSFDEFLGLMDHAQRFKEMLQRANPDVGLVEAYANEVGRGTWLDTLPRRTLRFGIFAAAGIGLDLLLPTGIGTAAGLTFAGFDQFILDKIARGWRPNTFVENHLVPFVHSPAADRE